MLHEDIGFIMDGITSNGRSLRIARRFFRPKPIDDDKIILSFPYSGAKPVDKQHLHRPRSDKSTPNYKTKYLVRARACKLYARLRSP